MIHYQSTRSITHYEKVTDTYNINPLPADQENSRF